MTILVQIYSRSLSLPVSDIAVDLITADRINCNAVKIVNWDQSL